MRELSLFTGAGGGLLGSLILGWRTVAAVENDAYCQRVLCARGGYMADADQGRLVEPIDAAECGTGVGQAQPAWTDRFPVHPDVRTFHPVPGSCDIVTGGFPCQPHSQAGKRLGGLDSRDLWPDTLRILRESDAPLGFFENVPGLLTSRDADGRSMFGGILGDLSEAGFDAEWCVLGADDVGAPHRRKRLWILAVAHGSVAGVQPGAVGGTPRGSGRDAALDVPSGRGEVSGGEAVELPDAQGLPQRTGLREGEPAGEWRGRLGDGDSPWAVDPADVGHADQPGPQGHRDDGERAGERAAGAAGAEPGEAVADAEGGYELDPWLALAPVGRVATRIPARVDRLRGLGNAQCPQTMVAAFTLLAREAGVSQ